MLCGIGLRSAVEEDWSREIRSHIHGKAVCRGRVQFEMLR